MFSGELTDSSLEVSETIGERLDTDAAKEKIVLSAEIEEEYDYEKCCADENGNSYVKLFLTIDTSCSGLHPIKTSIPEPSTCSIRTCEMTSGWALAAWVTKPVFSGCNCCLVDGKLVPDGYSWTSESYPVEILECCRGKMFWFKKSLLLQYPPQQFHVKNGRALLAKVYIPWPLVQA